MTHLFGIQELCVFNNLLPRPIISFLPRPPSLTWKPSLIRSAFSPSWGPSAGWMLA